MSGNLSSFIASILPYAESTSQSTGLPLDYVIAQSAEETGYGTSNAAVNLNNYFGISPGGSLASYGSPAESFNAYSNLINSNYPGAASQSSPLAIAESMVAGGYNTADPNYATSVSSIVPSVDNVLSALGIPTGATGTAANFSITNPTSSVAGGTTTANQTPGILATIGGFVSKIGIVLLGVVVVGVGLWMLAKGEGQNA